VVITVEKGGVTILYAVERNSAQKEGKAAIFGSLGDPRLYLVRHKGTS